MTVQSPILGLFYSGSIVVRSDAEINEASLACAIDVAIVKGQLEEPGEPVKVELGNESLMIFYDENAVRDKILIANIRQAFEYTDEDKSTFTLAILCRPYDNHSSMILHSFKTVHHKVALSLLAQIKMHFLHMEHPEEEAMDEDDDYGTTAF